MLRHHLCKTSHIKDSKVSSPGSTRCSTSSGVWCKNVRVSLIHRAIVLCDALLCGLLKVTNKLFDCLILLVLEKYSRSAVQRQSLRMGA